MINIVGSKERYTWKPEGLKNYLTASEVAERVGRDKTRLFQLEAQGRLPAPIRVPLGRLRVRLYSPRDLRRIEAYFATAKPGRPKNKRSTPARGVE